MKIVGWVQRRHHNGGVVFFDLRDHSGIVQVVVSEQDVGTEHFAAVRRLLPESSVEVSGVLADGTRGFREVRASRVDIISVATHSMSPALRDEAVDIFDPALADHLLSHRHLYIRHPKIMAILRFRASLMQAARAWFHEHGYLEITAPILTPLPLYDDGTAMSLEVHGERVFLTQCVGFYLEAAVHAFDRVYNIGPSFRGEESRSKRHLMEYWHIKAEAAHLGLPQIISMVESLLVSISRTALDEFPDMESVLGRAPCLDVLQVPFPSITYRESLARLADRGHQHPFGMSLGSEEEALLSQDFSTPFWVSGIPRSIEPFPYVVDSDDPEVTRTADLIATNGYGELLGTAEKIVDLAMLDERLAEKGKLGRPEYGWVREVHQMGPVPHAAFGMGVERMIRWLLQIPHVRDAIPFPRTFRRKVFP
ncbi:MAG: amino acid--tRNA ligase-related protein [Anaerolineae bacterium]